MVHADSKNNREIESLLAALRSLGVEDERVLSALRSVPREKFTSPEFRDRAWENHALPLDFGQTISQPYVVAIMTEVLQLKGTERVLEIGTGSGYQTAILSLLAGSVVSIERIGPLAERARLLLSELGYANVEVHTGDGSEGWIEGAPWDAIIVTAAGPMVPSSLVSQLSRDGGRLVMPVGQGNTQRLIVLTRTGDSLVETDLGPVAFVPLIGKSGWPDVKF